jgi:glycosyltransferase involved in cell wall biosynthesis
LLRRSRILVNLHSSKSDYFEWHRVLPCLANGCIVLSEASEDYRPLVDGQHLVLCRPEEIIERCEHYLRHEAERAAIAARASEFLRGGMNIETSCRTMAEHRLPPWERSAAQEQEPLQLSDTEIPMSGARLVLLRLRHRAMGSLQRRLLTCRRVVLRSSRVRHFCFALRSRYLRLVKLLAQSDDSTLRRQMRENLALASLSCCDAGVPDWQCLSNACYPNSPPPSVSVVVASRNNSASLARCLASIADAACEGIPNGVELIVIDDASTDGSFDLAREAIDRCGFPACVVKKLRATGPANSRNLGLEMARAPYVLHLDADGWIYPTCLAKLYQTIASSDADAAYAIVKRIDRVSGKPLGLTSQYDWDEEKLVAGPYLNGTAIFDRARLLSLGGYSRELLHYGIGLENYDLWLKLAQAGCKCAFRAEILSVWCGEEKSLPRCTPADRLPALLAHFEHKFAELLAHYPTVSVRFGWPVTVWIDRLDRGQGVGRPHFASAGFPVAPHPMATVRCEDSAIE